MRAVLSVFSITASIPMPQKLPALRMNECTEGERHTNFYCILSGIIKNDLNMHQQNNG